MNDLQDKPISDQDVDVIAPIKFAGKIPQRSAPRRPIGMKAAGSTCALIILLIGGGLLLRSLSLHPERSAPPRPPAVKPQPAPETALPPPPVDPTESAVPTRRAEQKPAEPEPQDHGAALLLDPQNRMAPDPPARVPPIDAVRSLIASGREHEKNNDLSRARAAYQEALQLDPESAQARQALDRVQDRLAAQRFRQHLSAGLTAYHHANYPLARTELLQAQALRPDAREVREALAQVDAAGRLARIEDLRGQAAAAEHSEDWRGALASYLAILEIDDTIEFAVQGRNRCRERMALQKRLDFYLQKPSVLEFDAHLAQASGLVAEAKKVEAKGRRLQSQVDQLAQLVAAAQVPVKISLESDGLTEIAVYKVGRLGRFTRRELQLRPGTYTIVGARNGYKDVRQQIVVTPGGPPLRVTIICAEKI
ncbi:MAG: hypothetical protein JSW39_29750 [Desulfobacterales bacterium]|nr:MAG: hypothetical protein JSW39_29750 [Desulfobacterales bacterium]